jgi:hypothetical protein
MPAKSWSYLGLADKGIISKVVVNPANPQQIFVAAMGNPYVRDAERGIFRSNNGGATWEKVLFVSNQAGASDLVMSPANPNILYASFWDRIRNNKESVIFGPNAKIYKSSDGGSTWTQLTNGLPTGTLGRTGLAVSQTNPDKLYVLYIDSLSTPHQHAQNHGWRQLIHSGQYYFTGRCLREFRLVFRENTAEPAE